MVFKTLQHCFFASLFLFFFFDIWIPLNCRCYYEVNMYTHLHAYFIQLVLFFLTLSIFIHPFIDSIFSTHTNFTATATRQTLNNKNIAQTKMHYCQQKNELNLLQSIMIFVCAYVNVCWSSVVCTNTKFFSFHVV